jgi:hypothetical protein
MTLLRGRRPASLLLAPGLVTAVLLAGCGPAAGSAGQATTTPGQSTRPDTRTISQAATVTPSPSPSPSASPSALPLAPGAGILHQTMTRPKTTGPAFHALVADLWLAVRTGRPSFAAPAFFPVGAYKQVKAIYDPAGDWRNRLWADFAVDVRAAHALLGHDARAARLVRVIVASADAIWVPAGACYNSAGYWHVANSRVVYKVHGQERSFGIASLISWRGVWYVVHFGGITRPLVGMVDAPATGPGYPGPQGGC